MTTPRHVLLGVTAAALLCGLLGCRHDKALQERPPTAVKIAAVTRGGDAAATRYSAQVNAFTQVDMAFKVGGYVQRIAQRQGVDGKLRILQEGDSVQTGAEIALIRPIDYAQKVDEARASYAQAKASVEQADLDFTRNEKLAKEGSLSQADLDAARARRDTARGSLDAARARVEEAQTSLSDTSLRSPLDGIVLKRSVEVGTLASPGTVAFTVAQVSRVKVVFGVPDTTLARVHLGAAQDVTTEAFPGTTFSGVITRVSPSADPKSRVFEVEVTMANDDQRLKTGMVVSLALADAPRGATQPLVPITAIVRSPSKLRGFALFVVEDDKGRQVAHARDVDLGEYLGRIIPVTAGLNGGERVVVQGAGLLSDGEPVEVIP